MASSTLAERCPHIGRRTGASALLWPSYHAARSGWYGRRGECSLDEAARLTGSLPATMTGRMVFSEKRILSIRVRITGNDTFLAGGPEPHPQPLSSKERGARGRMRLRVGRCLGSPRRRTSWQSAARPFRRGFNRQHIGPPLRHRIDAGDRADERGRAERSPA